MIIDNSLELADAAVLDTGTAGADLVGDVINLTSIGRDIGMGKPMFAVIRVDTAITSTGSATVDFQIRSDDTASIHTTTSTLHASTGAIAKAVLVAGHTMILALPPMDYEQYLGLVVVSAVADLTAGKIDCWITDDIQRWKSHADAL